VWVAGAKAFGYTSGLQASIAGFGTVTHGQLTNASWAEYGARIGYKIMPNATIDIFADGASGGARVNTRVHVGAGFRYSF
jgi:outer membrane autotransporter protein